MTQMVDPAPRPIRKDTRYGDIGVAKITISVNDAEALYRQMKGTVNFCFEPRMVELPGFGDYRFVYCRDPEGNLIECVSAAKIPVDRRFGGISWVGISVTDLDRSVAFYRKYLGFDSLLIDNHDRFSGLIDEISGSAGTRVRSCVLASSKAEGMVEFFEVMKPRGRSIPFATRWGDFGYLQVCLNGKQGADILQIASFFEKEGIEFVCGPQLMHDEKEGAFFYMKGP